MNELDKTKPEDMFSPELVLQLQLNPTSTTESANEFISSLLSKIASATGIALTAREPLRFVRPGSSGGNNGDGLSTSGKQASAQAVAPRSASSSSTAGSADQPPRDIVQVVLEDSSGDQPIDVRQQQVLNVLNYLYQNRESFQSNPDLSLQSVSPNWFFSPAHIPGNGPAGIPRPHSSATEPRGFELPFFSNTVSRVIEQVGKLFSGESSEAVNVVILDTAPDPNQLKIDKFPDNALLKSLLPKLHITPADKLGITVPTQLAPQNTYNVSDHGLFIAGLIHSIEPQANIYLLQIMPNFGWLKLEELMLGLAAIHGGKVLDNQGVKVSFNAADPMVINLSLCFTFPVDELIASFPGFGDNDFLNWVLQVLLAPLQILQGQAIKADLDEQLNTVTSSVNTIVVAAAGNKGTQTGGVPPKALYPAAFNSVLGVGALDFDGNRAWYSNEADTPPAVGIVTTGGSADVETDNQTPPRIQYVCLPDESLLSLYVSPQFPPRYSTKEPALNNTNGLAWWSGTSFATGVMSGILALYASRGAQLDTTGGFNSVGFLLGLETLFRSTTQNGEPIFRVKQIIN